MFDEKLWSLVKHNKKSIIITGITIFISAILVLTRAYLIASIINNVLKRGGDLSEITPLFIVLLGVVIIIFMVSLLENKVSKMISGGIRENLLGAILDKAHNISVLKLRQKQVGEYIAICTDAVRDLEVYFSKYIPQLLRSAILPVVFLIFIFPNHLLTGVILLVTTPLIPIFMMLIGKWAEAMNKKQWHQLQRLSGYLYDIFQGIKTLKLLNRGEHIYDKIDNVSNDFRVTTMSVLRLAFLSALTLELFTTLSIAIVAVSLGLSLINGYIPFQLALFLLLLAPDYYLPLRQLGAKYHTSLNGVTAYNTVDEFLNIEVRPDGDKLMNWNDIAVEYQNVSYHYNTGNGVTDISIKINSGDHVAIIGQSGGGKSTLINLLLGYLICDSGDILINGKSISNINLEAWHNQIAYIPQKPFIFSGTIRDNILMGFGEDRLNSVIDLAVSEFISDFPDGMNTVIGEGGINLSGGQRQIIAILRGIIKDAPLVIFDEAMANLDVLLEGNIIEYYHNLFKDKTVITITHRLDILSEMDSIVLVRDGHIVNQGNHEELYTEDEYYAQLVSGRGGGCYE